jgi:hypothetical protein
VLGARAQYLLFGAELDDGSVAEINMDSTAKRKFYNMHPQLF